MNYNSANGLGTISYDPFMIKNYVQSAANANSALSQEHAREQMAYQTESDMRAMDFSALEAAKNRDWQEYMSNTAHQREVQDLMAAGLNPILSASGGNGAAVTSGATASGFSSSGAIGMVDTALSTAIPQIFSQMFNGMLQLEMQQNSAKNALDVAAVNKEIQAAHDVETRFATESQFQAVLHELGTKYDLQKFEHEHEKEMKETAHEYEKEMASQYPTTLWGFINSLADFSEDGRLATFIKSIKDGFGIGTDKDLFGDDNPISKITDTVVDSIYKLFGIDKENSNPSEAGGHGGRGGSFDLQ